MDLDKFWGWFTSDSSNLKPTPKAVPNAAPANKPPSGTKTVATTQKVGTKKEPLIIESGEATSKKKLGYGILLFIIINSILGSSLFYLPSLGVISSGPASIIAWIILFIGASLMMLYIGELVTLHPTSGGTYEFCKRAYGRFGSFFAGWTIWIAGNFGMALNIVAAAQYFIPEQTTSAFYLQIIFAVIWILILNFMAFRGIDAGATMLLAFGVIATLVVLAMIIPSFISVPALLTGKFASSFDISLMKPFFLQKGMPLLSSLALSLLLISEAFFGFEALTYMANEAREPKKLHRVIIAGTVICGIIMTLYILSSLGTVSHQDYVNDLRPFAIQALNTLGEKGQTILIFGMYLVIVGAAAAWPIAGSRLLQAMAKDKLFIKHLAVLHPKHKSPYRAVYFQTVMVGLFSWFIFRGELMQWKDSYRTIYLIYILLSLLMLVMIFLTVPILRKKEAHLERPFKAPLGYIGPIIFAVVVAGLVTNWMMIETRVAWTIMKLAGSFLFLGLPFYFMVEMFYSEKSIVGVTDRLSTITTSLEGLIFPFTVRKKILKEMKELKGKIILDYGCGGGTMLKKMAPLVTETGKIYATDLSEQKVKVAKEKTKHLPHIQVFHDPSLHHFALKIPEQVDGVISVGRLSYMQKPLNILTGLGKFVKKGGEIIFVDFDKFFYLIPNVAWIENDKMLKDLFKKAGFEVEVTRKKSVFWQYIIITGWKD